MIVIKVELWPKGDPARAKDMGFATIENDGTGTDKAGNYKVTLFKWTKGGKGSRSIWKQGGVSGFDRMKRGPWDLLFRALRGILGARNP